jgi:hypothetical protein
LRSDFYPFAESVTKKSLAVALAFGRQIATLKTRKSFEELEPKTRYEEQFASGNGDPGRA